MLCFRSGATAVLVLTTLVSCGGKRGSVQSQLDKGTGTVTLPDGAIELDRPLRVPPNAKDLEIVGGNRSVLKALPSFTGRALLMVQNAENIRLRDFALDGTRELLEKPAEIPTAATPFVGAFQNNGILIDECKNIEVKGLRFREIAGFAILASKVKKITVEKVTVEDSGGRDRRGKNNTTGGILFEEGTDNFTVRDSEFRRVLGNGVWTHSTYASPRNYTGLITGNQFDIIGRDAIQAGHANSVRVENNRGRFIGYPFHVVDMEHQAIPVAVDTAGKVDESVYTKNHFEELNGKCFDLDGFHDGEVSENTCINRGNPGDYPHGHYGLVMNNSYPEMESQLITVRDNVFDGTKFGGIFVIGTGHKVIRNKLRNLNRWHCNQGLPDLPCPALPDEPGITDAGIFLGQKAERLSPSKGVLVEDNEIHGYGMKANCVKTSPGIGAGDNTIRNNRCSDSE